jgi:hypothetical protein
VGGVDAVRGMNYQHCHAILQALDIISDPELVAIRVEGVEDISDLEIHAADGVQIAGPVPSDTVVIRAIQVKSRLAPYTWARAELLDIFRRWASLKVAETAAFELVTDATLGPSGVAVVEALGAAHSGDLTSIASLLDVALDDPACQVMTRVHVRADSGGVEALLHEAEREVRSILPGSRTEMDTQTEATAAVDRLFKLLAVRAGMPAPSDRLITRDELVEAVGGLTGVPASDRWPTAVSGEYKKSVIAGPAPVAVLPTLMSFRADQERPRELAVADLLAITDPVMIVGRTGSGKSTTADLLRYEGAAKGAAVIVCHAEAYVPQRLDALVADSIGAQIARDLSRVVGRQALNDPLVLIAIDGVSEIPPSSRGLLAEEVRVHLAASGGARMVLIGRDEAATATLLPTIRPAVRLSPSAFDDRSQHQLARQVLFPEGVGSGPTDEVIDRECRSATAKVQHALGDAASNPMLLDLGLRLISAGASYHDRSSLYGLTIDRMSARANTSDIRIAVAVLGIVFARLLDDGRRYANPLEWERLMSEAVSIVGRAGVEVDGRQIRDTLNRSGVINAVVAGIGHTQLRGPVHDSFADYLAGRAHAEGLLPLPETLTVDDEQRLLFTTEMGGTPHDLCMSAARTLPFSLVRMSSHDRRTIADSTPQEVSEVLGNVLPPSVHTGVLMWRAEDRVWAQVGNARTEWDTRDIGRASMRRHPTIVCEPDDSPLVVAVRLWRLQLRSEMREPSHLRVPRPRILSEAQRQLEAYVRLRRDVYRRLMQRVAPLQATDRLAATVGPIGMTAVVRPARPGVLRTEEWPVAYVQSEEIRVTATSDPVQEEGASQPSGWTEASLEAMTWKSPERAAAEMISAAINSLARPHWL